MAPLSMCHGNGQCDWSSCVAIWRNDSRVYSWDLGVHSARYQLKRAAQMEILLVPPKIRSLVRDAALELYMDSVWDGQRGAGRQRESACQAFTFLICMGFKRMIEGFFCNESIYCSQFHTQHIWDWPSKQIPAFQKIKQYVNKHSRLTKKKLSKSCQ